MKYVHCDAHMRLALKAVGYVGPGAILAAMDMDHGPGRNLGPNSIFTLSNFYVHVKDAPTQVDGEGFDFWNVEVSPSIQELIPILLSMPGFTDGFITYVADRFDQDINVITDLTPADYLQLLEEDWGTKE